MNKIAKILSIVGLTISSIVFGVCAANDVHAVYAVPSIIFMAISSFTLFEL